MGIPRLNKETSLFRANAIPDYVAGVVTEAKAAIKVTTDQIALEVSRKVGTSEVISRINQSPESVTIDADRLDIATSTDGGNGVFVHPRNDATTGWRISDALELLKGGLSYFKVWLDSSVTKVRVGLETVGHVVFSPDGMEVFSDSTTSVAEFGASGARIGKASNSHITLSNNEFDVCDPSGRSLFNMELPEPGQDGLYAMAGSARLPGTSGPVTLAVPIPPITEMVGFYKSDGTLVEVPTIVNAEAGTYQVSSAITAGMYVTYYKTTTPPFIASIGTRVNGSTNGAGSIVLGLECRAISRTSLATGFHTVSSYNEQVAMGRYNVFDSNGKYALIIGNGTDEDHRSNAFAVAWDGAIETANPSGTLNNLGLGVVDGTITSVESGVTLSNVSLHRIGRLVVLSAMTNRAQGTGGESAVFTLPEGFRPAAAWRGPVGHTTKGSTTTTGNTSVYAVINTNGVVTVNSPAAINLVAAVYIIA